MRHDPFDGLGIVVSGTCLIHCLALPLLAAWLPAFGTLLRLPEEVHLVAVLLAVPLAGAALVPGWRHHGHPIPLLIGVLGLAALCAGLLAGSQPLVETGLTVAGAIALAGAHIGNWRLLRRT